MDKKSVIAQICAGTFDFKNTNLPAYEIGRITEDYAAGLIMEQKYDEAFAFLSTILFTKDRAAGVVLITEDNMLLYQMTEIYLMERNIKGITTDIWNRFPDTKDFLEFEYRLKFMLRKIWFGMSEAEWFDEFVTLMSDGRITIELLTVVTKYSVPSSVLVYMLECIKLFINGPSKDRLDMYIGQLKENGYVLKREKTYLARDMQNDIVRRDVDATLEEDLYLKDRDAFKSMLESREIYDDKMAFILCANDETYTKEVFKYLKHCKLDGMKAEMIVVKNAKSMCEGYNKAMHLSDARYKFYIHQDTFIVDSCLPYHCKELFCEDEKLGMLGIAGSIDLGENAKWWSAEKKNMCLYQDDLMQIIESLSYGIVEGQEATGYTSAKAMDGIFLATSKDVPWREDLFDHWHFYDISGCFEHRRRGYITGIVNSDHMTVLHDTTTKKDKDSFYDRYGEVFLGEYMDE
ncbi:MAG: glycosyltransferase family protein [Lachnospiraceae bacterium]|nr:glycosyltransferase family protein [Lachnospiraceae bacterium]